MEEDMICTVCHGRGLDSEDRICRHCHGSGYEPDEATEDIYLEVLEWTQE